MPSNVLADPDFMAAVPSDQLRYLSATDPDFAKANPRDQLDYLSHLHGLPAVQGIPRPVQPSLQQVAQPLNDIYGRIAGTSQLPSPKGQMAQQTQPNPAVGALAVGGATALGAAPALPFIARAAAKHPIITMMAAQEGIHQLRQIPAIGRFIPSAAEWLPFLLQGAKGPSETAEAPTPSTDQLPGRPYMPNPRFEPTPEPTPIPPRQGLLLKGNVEPPPPAPAPTPRGEILPPSTDQLPGRPYMPNPRYQPPPEPSTIPPRSGPLFLKGQVESPVPTKMSKLPWVPELEKSLGNEPYQVQPGVPIKNQPRISSAVSDYQYDPEAREFHVQPTSGKIGYIYGDVSPEEAQNFHNAESKGQAWQQMRNNPLVGKIVNGKRVAVKPTSQAQGSDLTDILTRSLEQAKSGKQ